MKNNIAIIGYGVTGQRFFAHLKRINNVNITKIIVKKKREIIFNGKNICGTFADIKNLNDLSGVIIATTFKASFKYAEFFLKKKTPILIEKPFCQTVLQSKKLFNLDINFKALSALESKDCDSCLLSKTSSYLSASPGFLNR